MLQFNRLLGVVLYPNLLGITTDILQPEDKISAEQTLTFKLLLTNHFTKPDGLTIMLVQYLRQETRIMLQQQLQLQ